MKIGNFEVIYTHKPAKVISDFIALGITLFQFLSAGNFTVKHPEIKQEMARMDFIMLWCFPVVCVITLAVCLVLTFKSPRFEKYNITEDNAQSVFDWYVFAVSLCRLPIMFSLTDAELIVQERLITGGNKSLFSFTYILCALVLVIIIRFSMHRITSLTKTNNTEKNGRLFIKSEAVDDNKEDEREKK